ncbi:MAG TPA: PEP-utilizing enzyme [Candidatus Limnocylindrales bacterium]|nr:PEP-utilizing enzyme [Candidatus Limnocylindrales bacterium]
MTSPRPTFRNVTMFGNPPDWVEPPSPDFEISWSDPADAELVWDRDEMHQPFPLSPLSMDFVRNSSGAGFDIGFEFFDVPTRIRVTFQHGYAYFAPVWGVPDAEVPALQRQMGQSFRAFGAETEAYWARVLPELLAIYDQMRGVDVDGLPAEALAAAWDEAWAGLRRAWGIHMVIIRGPFRLTEDLAVLYARHVPEAPAGAGYKLIQGRVDILHDVEVGMERLSALAAAAPAVRDALLASPGPTLDGLCRLEDGATFVAAVEEFISQHGHLGQAWTDLSQPSWSDDPGLVLAEVAKRLAQPAEPASERRRRLLSESDEMAEDVRSRLARDPDALAEFERVLALARRIGPLTETHNYWIDRMSQARMRTLAIRIGRRLVREGSIELEADVEYLSRHEVAELLVAPRTMRAEVAARRAEHERQRGMVAPHVIGGGASATEATATEASAASDGQAAPSLELHGTGASAGVARGPARVTLGLDGLDRIRPGDIIVCPATTPSWVPVFAIAAGLVTNTGGILAHAAVVAREFGLPAVVGVAGATSRIPDGALIEIDGTTGSVRVLES